MNGLCTAIGTAWANALAPVTSANVVLTLVETTDLTSATSAQGTQSVNHPGTHQTISNLPNSSSWVQQLTTQLRFRGGHPRIYWPATDQTMTSDGHSWAATYQALIDTACTGWISDINNLLLGGANLAHGCAFYYTHDPVTKVRKYRDPPLFYPTTSTSTEHRVCTQRRRLGKELT
jgi:hypothetical protein